MNFRQEQGHRRMGAWRGHCPPCTFTSGKGGGGGAFS